MALVEEWFPRMIPCVQLCLDMTLMSLLLCSISSVLTLRLDTVRTVVSIGLLGLTLRTIAFPVVSSLWIPVTVLSLPLGC